MASIGIIANPASGKDIRRLVSYATVIDNNEKVNIVKRIVLAAQGYGIDEIYIMPDSFMMGGKVIDELSAEGVLRSDCRIVDMPIRADSSDSTEAAMAMNRLGVGCVVILGGDGTSRAVAKGIGDVPIIPLSTGTNNVYPSMIEGTVAGAAAAIIALSSEPRFTCVHDKRIEAYLDGKLSDIALVDAVVSTEISVGARAIWKTASIRSIIVTRAHPASIGFSAVVGSLEIVRPEDNFGYSVDIGGDDVTVKASIAAGVVERLSLSAAARLELGRRYRQEIDRNCTIALDGEREMQIANGETVEFCVDRSGPWRVDIRKTLEKAHAEGFFRVTAR
ncbi:MAG: NAD(+)/NADH kinase [Synergistaceae bacterium]|jgi:predicted polyphosphate/ATP-dependent NAD kinase|nr:NAD(+)/NADH kinase [Synergistaceae bacterium]